MLSKLKIGCQLHAVSGVAASRTECGASFTKKLEGMLRDIDGSSAIDSQAAPPLCAGPPLNA